MQKTTGLGELFTLEPSGHDTFIGQTDGVNLPQLFGGQLVGQSVMAAGATVDDKVVHSTHTSFLRAGGSDQPVSYRVDRLRDGRTMSTRDVSAFQGDRLLCRTTVSCAVAAEGLSHRRPTPIVPGPDESRALLEVAAEGGGLGEFWDAFSAIEVRLAPDVDAEVAHSAAPPNRIWMRATERLSDDPLVHRAAVAYASDLMLMSTAVTPHGHVTGHERELARNWNAVSLDHTMWFRRDVRADEWLLFEHTTPMAHGGRVLLEAAIFDLLGDVVGHVAQEALVRAQS